MHAGEPASLLRHATGRRRLDDALRWLEEGRDLVVPVPVHRLVVALVNLADGKPRTDLSAQALRVVCRRQLASQLDTSAELFALDEIPKPDDYESALGAIAASTTSGTLADVDARSVFVAQTAHPLVMETLCQVAGLSYRDLRARVSTPPLPGQVDGRWTLEQVRSAFEVIDAIISGSVHASSHAATAMRPVEFLLSRSGTDGWKKVEDMRIRGVSYATLLTQRAVGSAWGAHRNATASCVQNEVIATLTQLLDDRGVGYTRLRRDQRSKELLAALGDPEDDADHSGESGHVNLLANRAGGGMCAVAVSVARNHGTASKSSVKLARLPGRLAIPVSVVIVGNGWAERVETVDLVRACGGHVFTERTLGELVKWLAGEEPPGPTVA